MKLDEHIEKTINEIMRDREEILRAFVAKYGFEPDRAIQVETRKLDGTSTWHVRRRTDEEMAEDSMRSCGL